ncbi:MAG TPA: glycoside hydrolase family 140 protein, partial [Bacteroidales bacterium]|nr:glycoside hydrolase family 140 protein [Bacteroidales bacterium]
QNHSIGRLSISDNRRFLMKDDGSPFCWLGDTGWLLFVKLSREEAGKYLEDRRQKGFNVIQVMVLHDVNAAVNIYGDSALINNDIATPLESEGSDFEDSLQYDFWDHVDHVVSLAAEKGLYMAMVPVWGSNVKSHNIGIEQARTYATWLTERYKGKTNIIWLNGGDINGSDTIDVWNAIGYSLREYDPDHLVTYHPRGRTQSSWWYHDELWLDFNMFQSGHRRYDQDDTRLCYGEDNWRYVETDYSLIPVKPTLDGEPSYEDIPQGLHDTLQPYWTDDDVRRYAYWSVFAGSCGHTYGHNSVMQFFKPGDKKGAYGVRKYWYEAIHDPGAGQMIYLKDLMLSRPYFERIPDQSLIADQGTKYDFLPATRGGDYAFIYTYTGRVFRVNMGILSGKKVKASWYSPENGSITKAGTFPNEGTMEFDPPGEQQDGNDWVLVLDGIW